MLLIAVIPGVVWIALLFAAWVALVRRTRGHEPLRHPLMVGLLAATALQALAASTAAVATWVYAISSIACLMGIYGMWVTALAAVIEAGALTFLANRWPRDDAGRRHGFGTWVSIWFVLNLLAILTHLRSAALCTV